MISYRAKYFLFCKLATLTFGLLQLLLDGFWAQSWLYLTLYLVKVFWP